MARTAIRKERSMNDFVIIGMLKSYISATLSGVGALKGAPCTILSIEKEGDTNTVTFAWKDDEDVTHESTMLVKDGEKGDTGAQGPQGDTGLQGVSITNIAKTGSEENVDTYTIYLSDEKTITFTVTNAGNIYVNGVLQDFEDNRYDLDVATNLITETQWAEIEALLA